MQKETGYLQEDSVIMNGSTNRKKFLSNWENKLIDKKATYLKTTEDVFLSL